MRVKRQEPVSTEVQMGPLIDCVFLLLIFFIVIAVTKKSVKDLNIILPPPPEVTTETKPRDKDLVIRVTKDGDTWVGHAKVHKQGMLDAIRAAAQRDPNNRVRFELDYRARVEDLMPIWDQLTHYGLRDWRIRTIRNE